MRTNYPSKSIRINISIALLFVLFQALTVHAQVRRSASAGGSAEARTAQYFDSIRKSPPQMLAFLRLMPKGGDLHNHLSGAIYAESYIQWAAEKGLCVSQTNVLSQPPCEAPGQVPVNTALSNQVLYRRLVDAWSMRYWQYS